MVELWSQPKSAETLNMSKNWSLIDWRNVDQAYFDSLLDMIDMCDNRYLKAWKFQFK